MIKKKVELHHTLSIVHAIEDLIDGAKNDMPFITVVYGTGDQKTSIGGRLVKLFSDCAIIVPMESKAMEIVRFEGATTIHLS